MRIDKYLWSVRLYKTRPLASDACANGRVKMVSDGRELKASHEVKVGEQYALNIEQLHKVVEVAAVPPGRVGAPLVSTFLKDLTPEEEYERIQMARQYAFEKPHQTRASRDRRLQVQVDHPWANRAKRIVAMIMPNVLTSSYIA